MNNDDEFVNINNLSMDDVEKIGEGVNATGALIMATGAVISGVIALIKLFSDDN